MNAIFRKLREYIESKSDVHKVRYTQQGYCSTCYYEEAVDCIDIDDLWEQIDEFCETFKEGGGNYVGKD